MQGGIATLESAKILQLPPINQLGTPSEIINHIFGGREQFQRAILELENELFEGNGK